MTSMLALILAGGTVNSESLSRIRVIQGDANRCPVIRVTLDPNLRFLGSFSAASGKALNILLEQTGEGTEGVEELAVSAAPGLPVSGATLRRNGQSATLRIGFADKVETNVFGSGQSDVSVQVAASGAPHACIEAVRAANGSTGGLPRRAEPAPTTPDRNTPPGRLSTAEEARIASTMAEARAAITAQDYPRAIAKLTKVLSFPENQFSAEAQELLGVVRERNGQPVHARAEYKAYLQKYPTGEGAVRVRQRLDAIETAEAAPPAPLRAPASKERIVSDEARDAVEPGFAEVRVARPSTGRVATPKAKDRETYPKIER